MLTSLAFIFLVGLFMAAICQRLKLPRIIGMLITGIVLGPYVLDLLDPSILSISADLRQMALIIILLKAGLSLNLADLKRVGRPAIMMSCVPASCEILAFFLFAPGILGSRCATHGSVDGRKIRHRQKYSPAHSGRGVLRRYFRYCAVLYLSRHGTGRSCKFDGFYQYPGFHRPRHCLGRNHRVSAQFVF